MRRKLGIKTFVLIFFLVGVYVFILGESGLLERISLSKKAANLIDVIDRLKTEQQQLQSVLRAYEEGEMTDEDFLKAGYIAPSSRLLLIKGLNGLSNGNSSSPVNAENSFNIIHARVIWCVISVLVILFWLSQKSGSEQSEEESSGARTETR